MNVLDAAKYFLSKADEENGVFITHLKLQKLVYYAQAWHLAIYHKPLMDTKFQAWAHGPVSRELYEEYRGYGYQPIVLTEDFDSRTYKRAEKSHLDDIWDLYGKYDAKYLEELTHQEDPWIEARGETPEGHLCQVEISEETMRTFYEGWIEDGEE